MNPRTSGRPGTRVTVDTGEFHGPVLVREDGPADGPAVVLVHGFCGSNGWFDRVVTELADTFRVVRLDLLGHGGTGGRATGAPGQARMVDAVLAKLGVEHAVVVGHSFGADVAVELAERSARVERLIILCQAPDYSDANLPRGNALMTTPVVGPAIHGTGKVAAAGLGAVMRLRPPKDPARRLLARRALADFRALDTHMFRVVLGERLDRLTRRPLDEQLQDAGKPALVVLGGKDHFYGDRAAPRYRAAGARVEIVPNGGHSLQIEQPGRVAGFIRDFATEPAATG